MLRFIVCATCAQAPGARLRVTMSLNICGSSEYSLLQITTLAARTSDVTTRFYQNLYVLILHVNYFKVQSQSRTRKASQFSA